MCRARQGVESADTGPTSHANLLADASTFFSHLRSKVIVDIHAHPGDWKDEKSLQHFEDTGRVPDKVFQELWRAMEVVDKVVILASDFPYSGITSHTNDYVAAFAKMAPEKIIGFASVDPKSPGATDELERSVSELGLKGVKISPYYQDFDPHDPKITPFYEKAMELNIPTLWHQATSALSRFGILEYANPVLLDKVARTFPDLKIIIAHLGFPWGLETVSMLAKHPNVFADMSADVVTKRWWVYDAMVNAIDYHVEGKIFFGSDYPWITPQQTMDSLRGLSEYAQGTNLPRIPDDVIEHLIHRNSMDVLQIE